MTTERKLERLLCQIFELPNEMQAELVQALVEMRSQQLGIYHLDDDERTNLACSAEDSPGKP
jgi:hypothetical protein